jgi:hypothetical protein
MGGEHELEVCRGEWRDVLRCVEKREKAGRWCWVGELFMEARF